MTGHLPTATFWRLVDIRPSVEADRRPAVAVRFKPNGGAYVLSSDEAEDAAWRLLEAAKLARAGIGRDDPEMAN